ncbi:MAG: ATP-binding protein [Anaerolineae bacterium]|nr:ATP-binding protein [Anaerolineae bacterium]
MKDEPLLQEQHQAQHNVRSLKHLIDIVTGRTLAPAEGEGESGFAENLPYPFLAIVGQMEMKLALLLNLINPSIGGVLLLGPRGTGKSTAARALVHLTPQIKRSLCYYGCSERDIEEQGMDAVCPDCAKRFAEGLPLTHQDDVKLVELPLNAEIEDVVGGLDERAAIHQRMRLRRGILSYADQNTLYVDEVNLLKDEIVNAILDAAAMGIYTVRRGPISATYNARFNLIGSMNPEEGYLRPQIMDRFGLRIMVNGLQEAKQRWEAYQRVIAYKQSPARIITAFAEDTITAREEIQRARELLPEVVIPDGIANLGLTLIHELKIASLRAEITLFEAARAHAAADERRVVVIEDLLTVAPMALRMRQSTQMDAWFNQQHQTDQELAGHLSRLMAEGEDTSP